MKIETIRGTLPLQTNVTSVLRGGFYLVIGLFRLNMVSVCKIQIEWGQQGIENIPLYKKYTSIWQIFLVISKIPNILALLSELWFRHYPNFDPPMRWFISDIEDVYVLVEIVFQGFPPVGGAQSGRSSDLSQPGSDTGLWRMSASQTKKNILKKWGNCPGWKYNGICVSLFSAKCHQSH